MTDSRKMIFPTHPMGVSSTFIYHALEVSHLSDKDFAGYMGVSVERVLFWKKSSEYITDQEKHTIYYYFKYLSLS